MQKYDKRAVGEEIRRRRVLLGLTQEKAAELTDRTLRFYARVELGTVGMSVDTLLAICTMLKTTPDSILLGKQPNSNGDNIAWITDAIAACSPKQQETAIDLLKVYLRSL